MPAALGGFPVKLLVVDPEAQTQLIVQQCRQFRGDQIRRLHKVPAESGVDDENSAFSTSSIMLQKASTCCLVCWLMANRRPRFPISNPAITIAIGPNT
jgi:hypothetical protein